MVVLFRFLFAIFKSRFRRRLGILDDCVIAMRVWPNDLDLNMHMNSGRYLSMMDIGRVEILARTRMLRPVLEARMASAGRRDVHPLSRSRCCHSSASPSARASSAGTRSGSTSSTSSNAAAKWPRRRTCAASCAGPEGNVKARADRSTASAGTAGWMTSPSDAGRGRRMA